MGGASRQRQPDALRQPEHPATCRRKGDAMADRDVHRLHALARAHDLSDHFARVTQLRMTSSPCTRLAIRPDQPALCAADRGEVQQNAQVTGEPETARVGAALSVAEHEIRQPL